MTPRVPRIKTNDTDPLDAVLSDRLGLVDLSRLGTEVRFAMKREGGSVIGGVAEILDDGTEAQRGHVLYHWETGQNSVAGVYRAEFQVDFPDAERKTFPSAGYQDIVLYEEIITSP